MPAVKRTADLESDYGAEKSVYFVEEAKISNISYPYEWLYSERLYYWPTSDGGRVCFRVDRQLNPFGEYITIWSIKQESK